MSLIPSVLPRHFSVSHPLTGRLSLVATTATGRIPINMASSFCLFRPKAQGALLMFYYEIQIMGFPFRSSPATHHSFVSQLTQVGGQTIENRCLRTVDLITNHGGNGEGATRRTEQVVLATYGVSMETHSHLVVVPYPVGSTESLGPPPVPSPPALFTCAVRFRGARPSN